MRDLEPKIFEVLHREENDQLPCCKNAPQRGGPDTNFSTEPEPAKADIAYEDILQLLYAHCRVPEQHLREQDLASRLGLGRTPVREALQRLAAEGNIKCIPQRGFFTRPMLEEDQLDSYSFGRQTLTWALNRIPRVTESWAVLDESSPDEPAFMAKAMFLKIAKEGASCEGCKSIQRFCFRTHPIRMEIIASDLRSAFVESLEKLSAAMSEEGMATDRVQSALMNHLDLEEGAVSRVVQEVNGRGFTGVTRPPWSS
ncbi:transcriptional regulator [Rhizobium leguminosarum bv. trifolii WSM2297]|uniref:Transcriptional regulator n=1 Tax=Rhizobium leguminosarum bv. trifolii WSM2297 TaxID=754762 RepID=J0CCA5_RHILT|nr:transcriptional regulator [Rhizobium leguminosarum bv. trifolii WSM2297]